MKRNQVLSLLAIGILSLVVGCDYGHQVLGLHPSEMDPRLVFPDRLVGSEGTLADSETESACTLSPLSTEHVVVSLGRSFSARAPARWDLGSSKSPFIKYKGTGLLIHVESYSGTGPGRRLQKMLRRFDRRLPDLDLANPMKKNEAALPAHESAEEVKSPAATPESVGKSGAAGIEGTKPLNQGTPAGGGSRSEPPVVEKSGSGQDGEEDASVKAQIGLVEAPILESDPAEVLIESDPAKVLSDREVEYRSEIGSFSGWRWIGHCSPSDSKAAPEDGGDFVVEASTPLLRLSRSHGAWLEQPEHSAPTPAFQILGMITPKNRSDYGLLLSILCAEPCDETEDLARFLGSVRLRGH